MASEFVDSAIRFASDNKVSLAVGLGVFGLSYAAYNKQRNLPPGPWGWPILGASREISSGNLHLDFLRLGKRYGDIVSLFASDKLLVSLNSYQLIKDTFLERPNDFSDRPKEFDDIYQLHDEIFTPPYTEKWREDKKFILHTLKTFGFSSGKGEESIKAQVDKVVELLTNRGGKPIDPKDFIYKATANIIASILFSGSWEYDDPALGEFISMTEKWAAASFDEGASISLKPNIISSFTKGAVKKRIFQTGKVVRDFYRKQIDEHIATLDPNNPRDFIDAYLLNRGVDKVDFQVMEGTVMILSPDAVDTLGVAVVWSMMFLAYNPEIQKKIQKELDDVIGQSRRTNLTDRHNLPYTEAFIMEITRMRPSFAVSFPHSNPRDVTIDGYKIPANSDIFANIWAVHYNPKYFTDPETFNPDRFIGNDGKLKKSEYLIPFSAGKRSCPGENLSKMELFNFVTTLMQMFSFSFPEGEPLPDTSPQFDGIVPRPQNFQIVATPRY